MTAGEAQTAEQGVAGGADSAEGQLESTGHGKGGEAAAGQETMVAQGRTWPDRQALEGPFNTRQLLRLDEALRTADDSTGLVFSIYVGDLTESLREHAEQLHAQLADPANSVLVAVSPNQRSLEIVTGSVARRRLPDRDCKLAAMSMASAFAGGDLTGGLVTGLSQLADRAGEG